MSATDDVWILTISVPSAQDPTDMRDWLEVACEASPVEIDMIEQGVLFLESYFSDPVEARLLGESFSNAFPAAEQQIRHCAACDWTTFWRHHFKPREMGESLIIVPEWMRDEVDTGDREVILINPGLSFGTGDHFTTRYCLETLDRLRRQGLKPDSIFDAGCGSAILSIAARKFGWTNILAVDFDELAIGQAHENLELNGITEGVTLETRDLTRDWPHQTFPLVVANLYGGLLMELAPRLIRSCTGTLVLSGIRAIEAEAVSTIFNQLGAREIYVESDPEWCGMTFEIP